MCVEVHRLRLLLLLRRFSRPSLSMTKEAQTGVDRCRPVTCGGRPSSHASTGINLGIAGFVQPLVCNQTWLLGFLS